MYYIEIQVFQLSIENFMINRQKD